MLGGANAGIVTHTGEVPQIAKGHGGVRYAGDVVLGDGVSGPTEGANARQPHGMARALTPEAGGVGAILPTGGAIRVLLGVTHGAQSCDGIRQRCCWRCKSGVTRHWRCKSTSGVTRHG